MMFAYGEKSGSLFSGFQMRKIAVDTQRRYMYYSAPIINAENPPTSAFETLNSSVGSSTPSSPTVKTSQVVWKKKIKIDAMTAVAKEHMFILEDSSVKERDLFQLEFSGETRTLASGETPAPGPLLAESADMTEPLERDEESIVDDPNSLRELYDCLRDQFMSLRQERERADLAQGIEPDPRTKMSRAHTLQSPRGKGEGAKGSRIRFVIRMRNELEFRRFWFVVQTMLGYDKLCPRPYRGLPPYDPRNGVTFSWIPMCVWHTFNALDKAVIYTFVRGDLVGRSTTGELSVFLHGCYLCITHDMVMILRDTGNIPRWIRIQEVNEFYYNADAKFPYVAFISDAGAPDVCFIPQPPHYGAEAIKNFNAKIETLRIKHVMHETCFASVDIRRVIQIRNSPEKSVRAFVEHYERKNNCRLNFDVSVGYNGVMSCPLPKEQLAAVWREVQQIYDSRDANTVSQSAIPLYRNNTNDPTLSAAQLQQLSRRMARERSTRNDIVGVSYEEARRVQVPTTRVTQSPQSPSSTTSGRPPADLSSRQGDLQTPQLAAPSMADRVPNLSFGRFSNNLSFGNHSFGFGGESLTAYSQVGGNSVQYTVPGACYLTEDDVRDGNAPENFAVDHHTVVMSQTPMAVMSPNIDNSDGSDSPAPLPTEIHIADIMSRSLAAMNASFVLRNHLVNAQAANDATREMDADDTRDADLET